MSISTEMISRGWTAKHDGSWERTEDDRMCVAVIRTNKMMTIMVQGRDGWASIGHVPGGLPAKTTARRATEMALR